MLIGICGLAGSGKTTVADILVRDHGFVSVSLADPMKRACAEWFNWSDETLWGSSEKRNAPDERYPRPFGYPADIQQPVYLTPRHALQQLGTDWGRACYENVWVDYCLRVAETILRDGNEYYPARGLAVEKYSSPVRGIVIPDCRFPNEAAAIHAKGGVIWKTHHGEGLQGAAGQHASEAHIDELHVDFAIPSGSLEDLPDVVRYTLGYTRKVLSK